jgi:flagellar biosynthetic protein FliR
VFWLQLVDNTELFFLVFARIMALIMTAPLVSSEGVPNIAKIGLAFFASIGVLPWVKTLGLAISTTGLGYVGLLAGEVMIGVIIGFFLQIVYAGFQTAGQFFSLQVGFGASEVYDPLSEDELPIIGQFFNFIAMFVFLSASGFTKLFLYGIYGSFQALNTIDIANAQAKFLQYFVGGLGKLFQEALTLSFPILGTLFVVSVAMGLMAKAAPQLNLMSLGFPINLMVAFGLLTLVLPLLINAFSAIVENSFSSLGNMFLEVGGQVPLSTTNLLTPPAPGGAQ